MSYFDDNRCIKRLQSELNTYGKLYIAFDFDNTIFDFHNEGIDCSKVISLLKKASEAGHVLILFTATSDPERLQFMKLYCKHFGINVKYINENKDVFPGSPKPYYNILLDDRAGLESSIKILEKIIV
jgi:hypothetical protein